MELFQQEQSGQGKMALTSDYTAYMTMRFYTEECELVTGSLPRCSQRNEDRLRNTNSHKI